ncbi:MAG: hypothetical protein RLY70_1078 [Planctomycetota bacterium]|jgi:hypothetical protein
MDGDEAVAITVFQDSRDHHHVYVFHRQRPGDAIACIERHVREGRFTLAEGEALVQKLRQDLWSAG